jgi:hypothetical protein
MSQPQTRESNEEAVYCVSRIAVDGGALLGTQPWAWESARWRELVFALLTQIAHVPERQVRRAASQMEALGLLNIDALHGLEPAEIGRQPHGRRILELLRENGFGEEQAARGLTAICEAAHVLGDRYGGRVQKYLRHYGEVMLEEAGDLFAFSTLSEAEAGTAFTYWLQNVLSMPVSLVDEQIASFCTRHGLEPAQLLAAADDIGLNVALVDDLVLLDNTRHAAAAAEAS